MAKVYSCRVFVRGYIPFQRRIAALSERDARTAFRAAVRAAGLTKFVDLAAIEIHREA